MIKVWIDNKIVAEFSDGAEEEAVRYAHMLREKSENDCKYIYLQYPSGRCSSNIV